MSDFAKYIKIYSDLIPSADWLNELEIIGNKTINIYNRLSEEEGDFAYAEGKWTLKTLLQHLIDTERVFTYRALRFSRYDASPVSSFDENEWAERCHINEKKLADLIEEFRIVRQSTILLYKNTPAQAMTLQGTVNNNVINALTIGKLLTGHNIHHINIINERYLPKLGY